MKKYRGGGGGREGGEGKDKDIWCQRKVSQYDMGGVQSWGGGK